MSEIKFVDVLPPIVRRRGGGRPEAPWRAELRPRPGEWAQIAPRRAASGYAKKPGFEFAIRTVSGQSWLFARYVGNGTQP